MDVDAIGSRFAPPRKSVVGRSSEREGSKQEVRRDLLAARTCPIDYGRLEPPNERKGLNFTHTEVSHE
jgi:hypothetical protein